MATKAAPQLRIVKKAADEVIAQANAELAAHGLPFDPLPRADVLKLIKAGAMEGVDRELRDNKDWMLYAVRFLMETSYPLVWEYAAKGRGLRTRGEQNAIFKLNYWVDVVSRFLLGEKVNFSHDDWNPRTWKTKQRNSAELAAATASLPVEHRNNANRIMWALDEKRMRDAFANDDRAWAKRRAQRASDTPAKEVKALDARRALAVKEREKDLQRQKRRRLAS